MNQPILEATDLSRDFGLVRALAGVTLSASAGEVLALLGPNGAGKTTFLRVARGLIEPDRGRVRILGETARTLAARGAPGVSAVGDAWEPAGWISLAGLADLQASAGRFNPATFRNWCVESRLPLWKRFGQLSKGQKRSVLCGLALATEPRLLLMDEPADGLDPSARLRLYQALRAYANDHDAVVIVTTHILGDIEKIADRVAILSHGQLVINDQLETLRQEIRQVTRPKSAGPPIGVNGVGLRVLGQRNEDNVDLWWVRAANADALPSLSGDEIRPVGLEELYLALTDFRAKGDKTR
ncbi:MAG TPA: ABC transporter ATP-binding protein [Tepidisphaeraceae bacterium]|jgi:ABC-2 type transport system ATP-binding protein|nr:ABC transporter ATP-binding protein [Tepidisphaeraceae bacterium]